MVSSHSQIAGAPYTSPFAAAGPKADQLTKAMNFLNNEFKQIREKMDVKLFECGFYKVEKVNELDHIQADIYRLAEEITSLEEDIAYAKAQIEQQQQILERLQK